MTRVLVADDSETILLLLRRRLALEGYDVQTVNSGQAVLDWLNGSSTGTPPDVVVLDAMMPGKSGIQVLRELRERGDETPVLILSAHRQSDELREALKLGADGCLTKPIDWDELTSKIDELSTAA
jgi:DNA-binding response OmpR family regulator